MSRRWAERRGGFLETDRRRAGRLVTSQTDPMSLPDSDSALLAKTIRSPPEKRLAGWLRFSYHGEREGRARLRRRGRRGN
jgi:hypothetical protein